MMSAFLSFTVPGMNGCLPKCTRLLKKGAPIRIRKSFGKLDSFLERSSTFEQPDLIHCVSFSRFKGEIGFFDFYIIPLAKKLQQFKVFGPTSDELLNFAEKNCRQWKLKNHGVTTT